MKKLTALLLLLCLALPVSALQYDGYVSSGMYHTSGSADRLEPAASDDDAVPLLRTFYTTSLRLKFAPRLQLKTRARYAYDFMGIEELNRFDLLQAALSWRSAGGSMRLDAGRISPFQLTLPMKVDGVDMKWQMNARSGFRLTTGFRVPLPGDFSYAAEDMLTSARYHSMFGRHRYSVIALWDAADDGGGALGGEITPPVLLGLRTRLLYLYNLDDGRTQDFQLYLSKRFNRNLLLTGRYRLAAPAAVTLGNMTIKSSLYDSARLAMLYRLQDWRLHLSQLLTVTPEQEWYHTRLMIGWRWIDLGAMKTFGADRDRWQATAALAWQPGFGLRLSGGLNLLDYESATDFASEDETVREQGMLYGSHLGVAWNWRDLHLNWKMYHISNFTNADLDYAWKGQLRNVVTLRYSFGGQL